MKKRFEVSGLKAIMDIVKNIDSPEELEGLLLRWCTHGGVFTLEVDTENETLVILKRD